MEYFAKDFVHSAYHCVIDSATPWAIRYRDKHKLKESTYFTKTPDTLKKLGFADVKCSNLATLY